MAVTEQLSVIPFPDGTTATVSWTLDQPDGTLQSISYMVPAGHSVTVTITNGPGTKTLHTRTVAGDGTLHTVATPAISVARAQSYQIQFTGV